MDSRQFPLVIETDGRDARKRIRMAAEADGEAGFTLVEVVVALTILLLVAMAFIPLYIYITQGSQANRMRVAATAVATGVIEEIRALPYDRVGTVGGNPAGDIEPVRQEMINGVKATVKVRVWWVDDPSNDKDGNDPIPCDYKKVQVTVTAPGFTGKVVEVADIRSLVAREAGEAAYPGGSNIKVFVTMSRDGKDIPVREVKVKLIEGPDSPQTLWTDSAGKALFTQLEAGKYTVEVDAFGLGMMVRPDQASVPITVVEGGTSPHQAEVAEPGSVIIRIVDQNGQPVEEKGEITVLPPEPFTDAYAVVKEFKKKDMDQGVLPADFVGGLWPGWTYNLQVRVKGYEEWNDSFRASDETREVTVKLTAVAVDDE